MRTRLLASTYLLLSGALAFACAQGESLTPGPRPTAGAGGTEVTTAGTGGSETGGTSTGGTDSAGTGGGYVPTAGTGGGGGTGGAGGTAGSGGTAGTGGSGGAAGTAGTGGSGGAAGTAGTGGGPSGDCDTIPAKATWVADASTFSNMCGTDTDPLCNPPEKAVDNMMTTRFSTGAAQASGMWLEVDLGESTAVNQVVLYSADVGDFPVGYAVTVSDTAENTGGTPVAMGAGAMGTTQTIDFSTTSGRYVLIELTASSGVWWSVHEVTINCD
jgi:hypothetical protein